MKKNAVTFETACISEYTKDHISHQQQRKGCVFLAQVWQVSE